MRREGENSKGWDIIMTMNDAVGQWVNIILKELPFPFNLAGGELMSFNDEEIKIFVFRKDEKELEEEEREEYEAEQKGLLTRSIEEINGVEAEIVIDRRGCGCVEEKKELIPSGIKTIKRENIRKITTSDKIDVVF